MQRASETVTTPSLAVTILDLTMKPSNTPALGEALCDNKQSTTYIRLHYLVKGKSEVLTELAPLNTLISELETLIYKSYIKDTRCRHLDLFKVHDSIYLPNCTNTFIQNLQSAKFEKAEPLESWKRVSDYWPTEPPPDTLNIFVKIPVVWCQIIDQEKMQLADLFKVFFEKATDISDLTLKVQEIQPYKDIKATDIVVWRCNKLANTDSTKIGQVLDTIDLSNKDEATILGSRKLVTSLQLADNEVLLAQYLYKLPWPFWSGPEISRTSSEFMEQLRLVIRLSFETPRLPVWLPPNTVDDSTKLFYERARIPCIDKNPNLLFHDLGKTEDPYTHFLFRSGENHRILSNARGTGKTRLLLEGLCHHWGFYIVAKKGYSSVGSGDLEKLIEYTSKELLPGSNKLALSNNALVASKWSLKVLLSRWTIFSVFVEEAKKKNKGNLPLDIKYRWLLFQAIPPRDDPFKAFMESYLVGLTTGDLIERLKAFTPETVLGSDFSSTDSFFLVLDDAQYPGGKHIGSFADADGTATQPILSPIVHAWVRACDAQPIRCIVSGTELPSFLSRTGSPLDTDDCGPGWDVVYASGDLDSQSLQNTYISRYLPPTYLSSPSGQALLEKMFEWLRGRYTENLPDCEAREKLIVVAYRPGFIAMCLQFLLTDDIWTEIGPESPHRSLNNFIYALVGYTPAKLIDNMLEPLPQIIFPIIPHFPWKKLTSSKHLMRELSKSLAKHETQGICPAWRNENFELVEYGFARYSDGIVHIREPVMLSAIRRFLTNRYY